jgi:hypothetical protein
MSPFLVGIVLGILGYLLGYVVGRSRRLDPETPLVVRQRDGVWERPTSMPEGKTPPPPPPARPSGGHAPGGWGTPPAPPTRPVTAPPRPADARSSVEPRVIYHVHDVVVSYDPPEPP